MKKFLYILLFVFTQNISAQQIFQKTFGFPVPIIEISKTIVETNDRGLLTGGIKHLSFSPSDIHLTRTDSLGNIIWSKEFGGSREELIQKIIRTVDGNFLFVGTTDNYGPEGVYLFDTIRTNMYAVKIDPAGNVLWARAYGSPLKDYPTGIVELNNGSFVISGTLNENYPYVVGKACLIWIDNTGNLISSKTFSNQMFDTLSNGFVNMIKTFDDKLIMDGYVDHWSSNIPPNRYLVITDSSGEVLWMKMLNDTMALGNSKLTMLEDGNFLYGFATLGFGAQSYIDFVVVKMDTSGALIWSKKYGDASGGSDNITAMTRGANNSCLMASSRRILKIDGNGNVLWSNNASNTVTIVVMEAIEKSEGGYALVGYKSPTPDESFLGQIDSTGQNCDSYFYIYPHQDVSVFPVDSVISDSLVLLNTDSGYSVTPVTLSDTFYCRTATSIEGNYTSLDPFQIVNPVKDELVIHYPTPLKKSLKIFIYDMLGRPVHFKSVENSMDRQRIDTKEWHSGIYLLVMNYEAQNYTFKILKSV